MKNQRKAFSLLEMMIVILIVSIMLAAAAPIITKRALVTSASNQGGFQPPIGTILPFAGDLSKKPDGWEVCDGTNGTPDLRDRFLEGSGSVSVGTMVSPGLPNLKGSFNLLHAGTDTISGVFSKQYNSQVFDWWNGSFISANHTVEFDANHANSIYGASTTVQPAAYTVYYIMRVK